MPGINYALLRVEKLNKNKVQEIKKRCAHVNREAYAENVDPALSIHNKCLVGQSDSNWFNLYKERLSELDYYKQPDTPALRKDAVIGLEFTTSVPKDYMHKLNITEWAERNVEWMKQRYGEDNVLHAVLHMDESTPHIHFFVTPVKDGKFNAKDIIGGRNEMRQLQTDYAKAMEEFGLMRGLKKGGRASYVQIRELYAEIDALSELPPPEENESLEEFYERANAEYKSVETAALKLKKENERLKVTQGYAHEIENKYYDLIENNTNNEVFNIGGLDARDIKYTIDNYPDEEVIAQYKDVLATMAEWGHEWRQNNELENADVPRDDTE